MTGRAIVLGTLVVLLLVLLASPLNRYFASRSALGDSAIQLRHDRQQLRVLHRQLNRWSDPGYVEEQARQRLQFAMPGDTVYVVVNKGERNDIVRTSGTGAAGEAAQSWNGRLWNSVQQADAAK
jgi:cell division protein FtsB